MRRIAFWPAWVAVIAVAIATACSAVSARQWEEQDFVKKRASAHFLVVAGRDWRAAQSVVGTTRFHQVQKGDTLLDLARYHGLGYSEIVEANPGVDVWVPPPGQVVLLPTEFIIPDVAPKGVVINIPEMRLYYFHRRADEHAPMLLTTYPVGLGREDWKTPTGTFKIREKTVNPTWVLPESIREEHRREGKPAPASVPGGDPENPLGKYRLRLSMPLYGIHGTNIPWGVGMQVSHGCIRLYPEDIDNLFPLVTVGDPGEFVYQPVKVGARDGEVYVEVHRDIYGLTPGPYREARRLLEAFGWADLVDERRLRRAIEERSGVPMLVSRGAADESVLEEHFRTRRPHRSTRSNHLESDGPRPESDTSRQLVSPPREFHEGLR